MASKSIDWDELLLTNDPKKKEIEVSFKKIDGEGNLISFGDEGGTNGGAEEGPDGTQPDTDDEGDYDDDGDGVDGGGGPIDPVDPPVECEPGNDCVARWDYTELDRDYLGRHSALLLREGYAEEGTDFFSYYSSASEVNDTGTRQSNAFELRNQSGTVVFNGNADSRLPTLGGETSPLIAIDSILPDSVLKYETPASPDNLDEPNRDFDSWFWKRHKWAELDPACEGYFCAPRFKPMFNLSRAGTTGSIWEEAAEVYDPPNTPNTSKWVGEGGGPGGAEQRNESWISIFCSRPYDDATPLDEIISPWDTAWPEVSVTHEGPSWTYTANGYFADSSEFRRAGYASTSQVEIRDNGQVWYRGSAGNGGTEWFKSKYGGYDSFMGPTVRDLDGWFTVHDEQYISAARKLTNDSGDYGIYDSGVTILQQSFATWYFNGRQITPRFLTSQFSRPTAQTPPTGIAHDPFKPIHEYLEIPNAAQRPSYGTLNPYNEGTFPAWFVGLAGASWISKPISVSSKWDAQFVDADNGHTEWLDYTSNQATIVQANCGNVYDLPVLAYVDHSDEGRSFMSSRAFRNMIKAHPRTVFPDYCNRIP